MTSEIGEVELTGQVIAAMSPSETGYRPVVRPTIAVYARTMAVMPTSRARKRGHGLASLWKCRAPGAQASGECCGGRLPATPSADHDLLEVMSNRRPIAREPRARESVHLISPQSRADPLQPARCLPARRARGGRGARGVRAAAAHVTSSPPTA